jgi:uncharacterized membrane protein
LVGAVVFVSAGTVTAEFVLVSGAGFTGTVVSRVVVPLVEFKTETSPLMVGIARSKADSIKIAAALMVILDKTDCVPRGPKAVLEILLVKSAPASAFPGCNKTVAIKTMHETKNIMYNSVTNILLFVIYYFGEAFSVETGSAN